MKTQNRFSKSLALGATAVLLLALVAIWNTSRVSAFNPKKINPDIIILCKRSSGMLDITQGQTARLNLVNLGGPDTRPIEADLMFLDSNGAPILTRDGLPVASMVTLAPGHAAFLDLNAEPNSEFDRRQIRATVVFHDPPSERTTIPTVEVFDNDTGRTTVFIGNADFAGNPDTQKS